MKSCQNIHIIGTSHISPESISHVTQYINDNKPDIIAIELDKQRLKALFSNNKPSLTDIKHLGLKGFFFNILGHYIEKKLGKLVGTSPGDEMKAAVRLARNYKLKLALIDQPIEATLKKLSKITFKEKLNFFIDIIKSPFSQPIIKPFDLKKVPSEKAINQIILYIKKRYPTLHEVLLEERNEIMAKNLYTLTHNYPNAKILAIVGAAHKNAIFNILRNKINHSNNSSINNNLQL